MILVSFGTLRDRLVVNSAIDPRKDIKIVIHNRTALIFIINDEDSILCCIMALSPSALAFIFLAFCRASFWLIFLVLPKWTFCTLSP
jgi:hypothetical protein